MTSRMEMGWSAIWGKRSVRDQDCELLLALIRTNGFDVGPGSYSRDGWLTMAAAAAKRSRLTRDSRVLEIGCGCGAFLYALYLNAGCAIAGIDYSDSLIASARRHIEIGEFFRSEATDIPFPAETFDAIFSHSVFQYFPDTDYARRVCAAAYAKLKPGGRLCIMDVNDKACETAYHKERARLYGDAVAYAQRYARLPHAFYDRVAFRDMLLDLGFRRPAFFDHEASEYANRTFRFNISAIK